MVVTRAGVRPGETVLVWGIGGGVSLAAMRVAKLCGARTIATSSSEAKLAQATKLGADIALDHAKQNVVRRSESTRLNSSHLVISYAVFCLKKKKNIKLTLCSAMI